jgi:hypothetical protein
MLAAIEEQQANVFISKQIADEVMRNKLAVAKSYFSNELANVKKTSVPDHLLGVDTNEVDDIRKAINEARDAISSLNSLADAALERISRSEDDVSGRLEKLFAKAITPTDGQLSLARKRKELGNPPGKKSDTLGDQITWELLISACSEHTVARVWIITRDEDFCLKNGKQVLLNPKLYCELKEAGGSEIKCFDHLLTGIKDFANSTGSPANNVPSDPEAARIEKKIDDQLMYRALFDDQALRLAMSPALPSAGTVFGEIKQRLTEPKNN